MRRLQRAQQRAQASRVKILALSFTRSITLSRSLNLLELDSPFVEGDNEGLSLTYFRELLLGSDEIIYEKSLFTLGKCCCQ